MACMTSFQRGRKASVTCGARSLNSPVAREHQLANAEDGERALLGQLDDDRRPGRQGARNLVREELGWRDPTVTVAAGLLLLLPAYVLWYPGALAWDLHLGTPAITDAPRHASRASPSTTSGSGCAIRTSRARTRRAVSR